ncbi:GA4 desaturase [Colletotrichum higginsianum IMI 349063]|uniref:GA4 desaturase n=1 Tax=Colletotrichum higginsianum (strain IMI 349063) TaxID=759273 RepID=A0A1B7YBX6_COLHI|nr:GA4 desaturase [Colletotrichum higginsianum IMI 349063]OBR09537.1 GA4 desaturase [Colletotrichum higginsianum IMI 349063]
MQTPINLYSESDKYRDERTVFMRDIRSEMDRFTIEHDGLAFLKNKIDIKDWTNEDEVREVLLRETPELIKKHGAKTDTTPVFAIHTDSTVDSGFELLKASVAKMEPPPTALPPKARVLLVNVWRPLKTITRDPLAFLVPSSIRPEERHAQIFSRPADTFKVFGKDAGDYWLDTASYAEHHEWVFLGHQQPDEPVMFLQWDSEGVNRFESKMSVFHSCFEDSEYEDHPERASMELKCLVFFDD